MPSYLVSGAFGHIGAYLVRRLLTESNTEVFALVRASSNPWRLRDLLGHHRLHILHADLNDAPAVQAALKEAQAETVVHAAWEGVAGAMRNDPAQISRNVTTSLGLFDAAQKAGCRTWAGVGSQAEYGSVYRDPRREDMLPKPETAYGVAKTCVQMATEKMAALAEMRFLWLRVFSTYGPQDDAKHLLPTLVRALLRGERPGLTPGEQQWDYLFIEDAADAITRLLTTPNASGIYNIAQGESHSLRDVISQVRDLIDPNLPLGFGDVPYRHDQVMLLKSDVNRLRSDTGWGPRISLAEGLRRTIHYYRTYLTPESEWETVTL